MLASNDQIQAIWIYYLCRYTDSEETKIIEQVKKTNQMFKKWDVLFSFLMKVEMTGTLPNDLLTKK